MSYGIDVSRYFLFHVSSKALTGLMSPHLLTFENQQIVNDSKIKEGKLYCFSM